VYVKGGLGDERRTRTKNGCWGRKEYGNLYLTEKRKTKGRGRLLKEGRSGSGQIVGGDQAPGKKRRFNE